MTTNQRGCNTVESSAAVSQRSGSVQGVEEHAIAARNSVTSPRAPKVPTKPKPKPVVTAEESVLKEFDEVLDKEEILLDTQTTDLSGYRLVENIEPGDYANGGAGMPSYDATVPVEQSHYYPVPDYDDSDVEDYYVNLDHVPNMIDCVQGSEEVESNYANLEDIQKYIHLPGSSQALADVRDVHTDPANGSASGVNLSGDKSPRMSTSSEYRLSVDTDAAHEKVKLLPLKMAQKQGHLHRLKLMDCGKKSKKSWSLSYVFLYDDKLHFFKEQKTTNRPIPRSLSSLGKPENSLDLNNASIRTLSTTDKNKKEVIEVTTANSTQYLLHHSDVAVLQHWLQTLENNISVLKSRTNSSPPATNKTALAMSIAGTCYDSPQLLSAERAKYADKLKGWLKRRPACDTLRACGIYKDVVFGTQLSTICGIDGSTVPRFVQECIIAVDNRGLTLSGIYRTNGNVSAVQKLRMMVDQNEYYDLTSAEWDINVVTSALKLFLRELPEPLFTFQLYDDFLETLTLGNRRSRVIELLNKLPTCNYDTLSLLFSHLIRVIQHSDENKMLPQNLAIVFGPTLLRSPVDTGNLTVSLVQQGQFVEFVLVESHQKPIFK